MRAHQPWPTHLCAHDRRDCRLFVQLHVPCSSHSRVLGAVHHRLPAVSRLLARCVCEPGQPPAACVPNLSHLSVAYKQWVVLQAACSACGARVAAAVQLYARSGEWTPHVVHVQIRAATRVVCSIELLARPRRQLAFAHGMCGPVSQRFSCRRVARDPQIGPRIACACLRCVRERGHDRHD